MKKIILTLIFLLAYGCSYEVSDKFFGAWGIDKKKALLSIESAFDFKGCYLDVNIQKLNKIHYHKDSCLFINDKSYGKLVCIKDKTRCVKKSHIIGNIIKSLNKICIWYVYNVASNDTLNVRKYAGTKYKKLYELPYNASGIKVLNYKIVGRSTWYKIRYKNVVGWVNSKFLNCRERN